MTICLVGTVPLDSANGAATFNSCFLQLFSQSGHQVIYLFVDVDSGDIEEDVLEEQASHIIVRIRKSYHLHLKKYAPFFRSGGCNAPKWIASGLAIRKWLDSYAQKYNIDIIEVSDGGGIGAFLIDDKLPPVILTANGSNLQISRFDYTATDEHGKVIKRLEQLAYENAEAVISHSPINSEDLKQFTNKPIFTLPIPWTPISISDEGKKQSIYGLVVGSLRYLKGPDLLCKALQKIEANHSQLCIQWFGEDTDSVKGYKSVSAYLQKKYPSVYQKTLKWHEPLSRVEIIREISNASYLVIPSLWETYNYVAIEAASLGKPIIITKETGASSLFTNSINALIIDTNEEDLSEAILKFQNNNGLRDYIGANARLLVRKELKESIVVNKRVEVYQRVIHERRFNHTEIEKKISFLNSYLTFRRRAYFYLRGKLKDIYNRLK